MAGRKRRNRVERGRLARKYRGSDLTQPEFCARHGVSPSSLARWCAELESQTVASTTAVGFLEVVAEAGRVAPVGAPPAIVRLGETVCLELTSWPAPEYLAMVARAYQALAP